MFQNNLLEKESFSGVSKCKVCGSKPGWVAQVCVRNMSVVCVVFRHFVAVCWTSAERMGVLGCGEDVKLVWCVFLQGQRRY